MAAAHGSADDVVRVLMVCTANTGRSPLAEAFLERHLAERGVAEQADVCSAGLLEGGQQVADSVVAAAADRGADLVGHSSTHLDGEQVAGADLILCMTERHLDYVEELAVEARDRAFLLGRLVRLLGWTGPRRAGESLVDYLGRVREAATELEPAPEEDRVPDPYGRPPGALSATADRLKSLTSTVAGHLWPGGAEAPVGW